ncbi:MAG: ABC transporter substrate-binding protein [Candidatus Dormibacteria bacterium]
MRRSLAAAALLAGLAVVGGPAAGAALAAGSSTLTVGEFTPFSGADAAFGPELAAGCIPAIRLINAQGGVMGHPLNCVEEDTRGDPADAVPAADQMIASVSHLIGVLGPSSDEALATIPILNRAQVPMFVETGQAAFDHTTDKYFWRITPADDVKGFALALWAHRAGYTRAAAVFGSDVGSQSDVPTLLTAWKRLGGKMVINQRIALDSSSYETEVEQLVQAKPQVIFTEVDPQTGATYFSELQQLHGLIPVIGTEVSLEGPWLRAVTDALGSGPMAKYVEGMQPYAPPSGPAWKIYNKALLAARASVPSPGQWSADPYTMTFYDAVNVMALAMLKSHSTSRSVYDQSVVSVTAPGAGKKVVYSYAQGKAALAAGKQIQYVGAGGLIAFNRWHNSTGAFEAAKYVHHKLVLVGSVSAGKIAQLSR